MLYSRAQSVVSNRTPRHAAASNLHCTGKLYVELKVGQGHRQKKVLQTSNNVVTVLLCQSVELTPRTHVMTDQLLVTNTLLHHSTSIKEELPTERDRHNLH